MIRNDLRNIAIVAHVDHGKTTLLNEMLKQGGAFRENQVVEDRVMDSNALERERGITITSKNTAIEYNGVKINVIDTPGHADFGGEVERILKMVDGILLLVDAFEGCMPQTRFVLQKAMELGHKIIVVVNKIDRPDARLYEIEEEVLELLLDLNATEEQLDSPVIYCSGREGVASYSPEQKGTDLKPLFDKILEHIDPPQGDPDGPLQLMVSSIDYNDYVGRIAVGRITRGTIRTGQEVMICDYHNPDTRYKGKVVTLYQFDGLKRVPCDTRPQSATSSASPASRTSPSARPCATRRLRRAPPLPEDQPADRRDDLRRQHLSRWPAGTASIVTSRQIQVTGCRTRAAQRTSRSGSPTPIPPTPSWSPGAARCTSPS